MGYVIKYEIVYIIIINYECRLFRVCGAIVAGSSDPGLSFLRRLDGLPSKERIRLWESHLSSLDLGGSITPLGEEEFTARMLVRKLENCTLLDYEQSAGIFRRRGAEYPAVSGGSYALGLLQSGNAMVEQYGRCVTVSPGDCCFLEADAPFSIINGHYRVFALIYDRKVVGRWLPDPQKVSGMMLSQSSPWGMALSAALKALSAASLPDLPVPVESVLDQINCLLALASGQDKIVVGSYHGAIYQRLQQIIRQNATCPTFSPEDCAERCAISLRSLHLTFAAHNTSFCRELKRYRLEIAHYYLRDARYDRKSIAEISSLCGFANVSHFTTCFGKAYGAPPAKYRKTLRP